MANQEYNCSKEFIVYVDGGATLKNWKNKKCSAAVLPVISFKCEIRQSKIDGMDVCFVYRQTEVKKRQDAPSDDEQFEKFTNPVKLEQDCENDEPQKTENDAAEFQEWNSEVVVGKSFRSTCKLFSSCAPQSY